jgi:alpha-beta hydrolase superfamily lysophospholipase
MHPSIDYPKSTELSEQARHYVRALIKIYGILPFEYPQEVKKGEVDESLVIGSVDAKVVHKREAAKKRKARSKAKKLAKKKEEPKKYNALPDKQDPHPSPAQLAELAEQARLALAEASKLAGEPVIYCCAAIRKEDKYECRANCQDNKHYQRINELR